MPRKKAKKTPRQLDDEQLKEDPTEPDYKRLSYDEVVELAREEAARSDDDLEVDDEPLTSRGPRGCFVQTWTWVPYPDKEEEE